MNQRLRKSLSIGLFLLACGAGWVVTRDALAREPEKRKTAALSVNPAPVSREAKLSSSYASVVRKAAPSVVNIFTTKTVKNPFGQDGNPFFEDPMFRRFFGGPFGGGSGRAPRTLKQRSLGSGVIVTKDGYVLTNNHVVDGADEIKVAREKPAKEYTAKVVGRDPRTDVALLKIEADDLPFVTFADSDQVEVGDVVLAIGNPFRVGQTVTMGIASAVGRGGMGIEDYEDFIQTDAAINPGNSGGALVDAEGRLVGINTAILSGNGGNQGVGFAIPANLVRSVMDQLMAKGTVERGFLGVRLQELTPELAQEFNAPDTAGALVGDVTENSAAEAAGLKRGDVIVALDGKPVADSRNLKLMVGRLSPGTTVEVKALRNGKEKTFRVTLKQMPDEAQASVGKRESAVEDSDALNGVEVGDITPAARRQFDLPNRLQGALITNVDPDSASYEAGLRQGDVLQEIDRKPVKNAEEAVEISKHVKTKKTLVLVWSHGTSGYVMVDEGKAK